MLVWNERDRRTTAKSLVFDDSGYDPRRLSHKAVDEQKTLPSARDNEVKDVHQLAVDHHDRVFYAALLHQLHVYQHNILIHCLKVKLIDGYIAWHFLKIR